MRQKNHSTLNKKVTIASRGSTLALWQANYVKQQLKVLGLDSEVAVIKTTGDKVQDRFLHEIGGKGLFIKEIEHALLNRKADLAVHSFKDMPAKLHPEFVLPAVLPRHNSGDLIIFKSSYKHAQLPSQPTLNSEEFAKLGSITVATGSLRRGALLKEINSEVKIEPIRGNVDTRLRKLEDSEWDALILAAASMERLKLKGQFIAYQLDPNWFVPSPAQGALVIEALKEGPCNDVINHLNCKETEFRTQFERSILLALGGDCTLPIGIHSRIEENNDKKELFIDVVVLDNQGDSARINLSWDFSSSLQLSTLTQQVIDVLMEKQVNKILSRLNLKTL